MVGWTGRGRRHGERTPTRAPDPHARPAGAGLRVLDDGGAGRRAGRGAGAPSTGSTWRRCCSSSAPGPTRPAACTAPTSSRATSSSASTGSATAGSRRPWTCPGLEDEYLLAGAKPKLMYVKRPAPEREGRLEGLLDRIRSDDDVSYKAFADADELEALVADDLALLLSEAFLVDDRSRTTTRRGPGSRCPATPRPSSAGRRSSASCARSSSATTCGWSPSPAPAASARRGSRCGPPPRPPPRSRRARRSSRSGRCATRSRCSSAIAAAVGLRDSSGITVDALRADLADRSLLLVIDNFEHVMGAAELLPALLRDAPRLKVLVTSREALRLQAEHEFPVPPLEPADSVRMFAERAAAVRPGFTVDAANAAIVERICRRLEGVPLAIELAAARTKLLSPEAILERLEHRLDFLVGGPRDLPERQQALRSTIEWSYDLLDDAERRLFSLPRRLRRQLLAGRGRGARRDGRGAASATCSTCSPRSSTRACCGSWPTAGEPRFRMLEMIAEFALSAARRADDADRVARAARRRTTASVGVDRGRRGVAADQRQWLPVLGDEDDGEAGNLRAALAWFLDHGSSTSSPRWRGRCGCRRGSTAASRRAGPSPAPRWRAEGELSRQSRARLLVVVGHVRHVERRPRRGRWRPSTRARRSRSRSATTRPSPRRPSPRA